MRSRCADRRRATARGHCDGRRDRSGNYFRFKENNSNIGPVNVLALAFGHFCGNHLIELAAKNLLARPPSK